MLGTSQDGCAAKSWAILGGSFSVQRLADREKKANPLTQTIKKFTGKKLGDLSIEKILVFWGGPDKSG